MKLFLSILVFFCLLSCKKNKPKEVEVPKMNYYWYSQKAVNCGKATKNLKYLFQTLIDPDSITINNKKFTWVTLQKDIHLYKEVFSDVYYVDSCVVGTDCDIEIYHKYR